MCTEPESQKSIKLQSWANVIKCCVFMWISPDEIFPLLSVTCHFVPLRVFVLSSVKQTEVSPLEDNYRLSTKMAELNPARWYLSRWREHKKHTQAMVFSAQGPLPGIMMQLHVGMMDLVRNLVWDVQFYLMWLALWAFPGSSRIEKEMLNNRQPVPAPPFGGRSLHSKKVMKRDLLAWRYSGKYPKCYILLYSFRKLLWEIQVSCWRSFVNSHV